MRLQPMRSDALLATRLESSSPTFVGTSTYSVKSNIAQLFQPKLTYLCDSFVYDYLTENDHTCSPGVSLGEIGSEIHRIGFPRQKGLLSQVLSRRRDLFEVYDNSRNGLFVFALPPRRQETGQPETRRPQPPNAPPSFVEPPSGYFFAADLQIMLAPSCIFFRPLSGGSAVTVASAPSSSSAEGISSPMRGAISELSSLFPTTDLVRILDFYVIF